MVLLNMLQGIYVALVDIQVSICRELRDLVFSSVPLIESRIKLTGGVSIKYRLKNGTYHCCDKGNHCNQNLINLFSMRTFISWEKVSEVSGKGISPSGEEHVPDDSDDAIISVGSSAHH
jgi:hypothetical protein